MATPSSAHDDAIVVYESMFGGTRTVAQAIARGLGCSAVRLADLGDLDASVRLLIAGAPTHAHGLSRPETRAEAGRWAADPLRSLTLEPGIDVNMRDWLASVDGIPALFATFDTRADMAKLLSGAASFTIAASLKRHGAAALEPPASFFVDKDSHLGSGEVDRAVTWGQALRVALDRAAAIA